MNSRLVFFLHAVVGAAIQCCILNSCKPGWNDPIPITPEPNNPCGFLWHSCGNGKCCHNGDDCRPAGYCAFGGIEGPTWGAARDAGPATYIQLTPEQIRARGQ